MAIWQSVETSVNLGFLTKENSEYILLETGDKILLSFGRNTSSNWIAVNKSV